MIIVDKGRTINERSLLWSKTESIKGIHFMNWTIKYIKLIFLEPSLFTYKKQRDTRNIIQNHLQRNKMHKIIKF
jgi:DNA polymerase-3 subunit epsilon